MLDEPTQEQRLLLDASADLIAKAWPIAAVREHRLHRDQAAAAEYRLAAAELGWFSMLVPEEYGGGSLSGNGMLDAAMIAYTRGAALQPGPFVATNVVAHALASAANRTRHSAALAALISGEQAATWALGIPGLHGNGSGVRVTAVDRGFSLSGSTTLVLDGDSAAWILVTAAGRDGLSQFLLPAGLAGVTATPAESLDISRRFATLSFHDTVVGPEHLLGSPGQADAEVDRQLAIAAVLTAAESVGAIEHDLAMAVQYAKDRVAFGRPIGSFQAVKHSLADSSLLVEMCAAITVAAARSLGEGDSHGLRAASMAKAFVSDHGIDCAQACFQVFGGIGFTWEHDQHLYLRRITTDAALYGEPSWHRERLCVLSGL